jgi:probable rRNA maturation factor
MNSARIDIHVEEPFRDSVPESTLKLVAEMTLARERRSGPARASVTITDDETLRALNREHRGEDSVTDVLSFGTSAHAHDGEVDDDEFPIVPGEEPTLGDVIISFPQALRQAASAGHSVERELALLTAHGILHLLGYDHADVHEEKVMFAKQETILDDVMGPARRVEARS